RAALDSLTALRCIMPGWKKNIPACLQPDQEGGKSRPGPDLAGSQPYGPVGQPGSLPLCVRVTTTFTGLRAAANWVRTTATSLPSSLYCRKQTWKQRLKAASHKQESKNREQDGGDSSSQMLLFISWA
ncbi:hypothetical protein GOODEAATRI_000789, partial [Goodea atripinnis]